MNSDGTNLRLIASSFHISYQSPKWSPNGHTIAFYTLNPNPCCPGTHSIYLIAASGANTRPLLPGGGGNDLAPDWSPDGTEIAFMRAFGYPDYRIYAAAVNGSYQRQIVANGRAAESPTWAPDGSEIAFVETQGQQDIAVVSRDGTNLRVIPGVAGSEPVWAPPPG
jgi:Tol biopolymer transport system component